MAKAAILSQRQVGLLKDMLREYQNGRLGIQAPRSEEYGEDPDYMAPEVYVARPVDVTGIPSMQQVGTSGTTSPNDGDIAGSTLCDIFRLKSDGTLQSAGFQKNVFNLSQDPIGYEWFTIHRDKFGSWIAHPKVRNLMATPRVTYKAGEDAEFQIMSGNSTGGQFEKGLEPPISEWVRGYVRKGIVVTGRPYILAPVSPCGNPGTSPTEASVYDVVDPTTHFLGTSVNHINMGSTGDVTVGPKLIPVVALFGAINHAVSVWVGWDEINVRFIGVQISCPTGTGT